MKKVLSIISACLVLACVLAMAVVPAYAAPSAEELEELTEALKNQDVDYSNMDVNEILKAQNIEVSQEEIDAITTEIGENTPKEAIVAKAKELIPASYQSEYIPLIENTLQQVEVTSAQAVAVIVNMKAAKAAIKEDKGNSLSEYTETEQKAVMAQAKAACNTLGLVMTVEAVPEDKATHEGDTTIVITKKDTGKVVSTADFDVKKTDSAVDYTMIIAGAAVAIVAIVSAVYGKKLVASR